MSVIEPDTTKYKDPLTKVTDGYGYYGVLTESKCGNYVQCHVCGEWFRSLNVSHLKTHRLNHADYKELFELAKKTPLASRSYRREMAETYNEKKRINLLRWHINKKMDDIRRKGLVKSNRSRKGDRLPLETRNKRGTCPDQLIAKIKQVAAHHKTDSPTRKQFYDHFGKGKHIPAIYRQFGSWVDAVVKAGLRPASLEKDDYYSDENLLKILKKYYKKYKRVPLYSDHDSDPSLPDRGVYAQRFGGLNQARAAAGIPIVVMVGQSAWAETKDYNLLNKK